MMRILRAGEDDVLAAIHRGRRTRDAETERIVHEIVEDVRVRGDAALLDSARRFDAPTLPALTADEAELGHALPERHERAVRVAAGRIAAFHDEQLRRLTAGWSADPPGFRWHNGSPVGVQQRLLPVASAGIYAPGGGAAYPSSILMNALPARSAGVGRIVATTPARPDGSLHPAIGRAARLAGVERVVKVGGAAAIAALALGTESVPRVDVIAGPGNRFVNEAKRHFWGAVGLDGYAGPSEVAVLVDDHADPRLAAADLLTQVEHAGDNVAFLIGTSEPKLREVLAEVERRLVGAPREATLRKALAGESLAIVARDQEEGVEIVNAIAPEHLTLALPEPESALPRVRNAGCVLLGEHTPESAGDYCLGPSHTLPTGGAARFASPVNVLTFMKLQSLAQLTPADLEPLIDVIEAFGEIEGFPAHADGARVRRYNEA